MAQSNSDEDDDDEFDDDEELGSYFSDIVDPSDVKWDIPPNKNRRKIVLVATSETDFNLMKFYLALLDLQIKIEEEMGIMAEVGEH